MKPEDYVDDPEPGDMNDPSYREEMFKTFSEGGLKPADLRDKKLAADYEKWLAGQR